MHLSGLVDRHVLQRSLSPVLSCHIAFLSYGLPEQISGDVDQSAGMLDDEAKEKGYALMCVAEPQSDCRIRVIEEVSLYTISWSHSQASHSLSSTPHASCCPSQHHHRVSAPAHMQDWGFLQITIRLSSACRSHGLAL